MAGANSVFSQLAFSQVFSRANPGIADQPRLKTRAAQEIKLGNVSTRPIVVRKTQASILCEGRQAFSRRNDESHRRSRRQNKVLVSANVSAEPDSPLA